MRKLISIFLFFLLIFSNFCLLAEDNWSLKDVRFLYPDPPRKLIRQSARLLDGSTPQVDIARRRRVESRVTEWVGAMSIDDSDEPGGSARVGGSETSYNSSVNEVAFSDTEEEVYYTDVESLDIPSNSSDYAESRSGGYSSSDGRGDDQSDCSVESLYIPDTCGFLEARSGHYGDPRELRRCAKRTSKYTSLDAKKQIHNAVATLLIMMVLRPDIAKYVKANPHEVAGNIVRYTKNKSVESFHNLVDFLVEVASACLSPEIYEFDVAAKKIANNIQIKSKKCWNDFLAYLKNVESFFTNPKETLEKHKFEVGVVFTAILGLSGEEFLRHKSHFL